MQNTLPKPAAYKVLKDAGGNRYRFFCDISGARIYTTKPITAETPEKELTLAWEEARDAFNRCEACDRWVSNAMYNADTLRCVDCSPWENPPNFCIHCGTKIPVREPFCRSCGTRLQYGEVWE